VRMLFRFWILKFFRRIIIRRLFAQSRHLTYLSAEEGLRKAKEDWKGFLSRGERDSKRKNFEFKIKRALKKKREE